MVKQNAFQVSNFPLVLHQKPIIMMIGEWGFLPCFVLKDIKRQTFNSQINII